MVVEALMFGIVAEAEVVMLATQVYGQGMEIQTILEQDGLLLGIWKLLDFLVLHLQEEVGADILFRTTMQTRH